VANRVPVSIAIDAGTTGVRALVVDEQARVVDLAYRERLKGVKGIRCLGGAHGGFDNHAYFPILVEPDFPISRDELCQKLKDQDIHPRRYFFPLISEFPMYRGLPSARRENLPVASSASQRVLCLPIYPELTRAQQTHVIKSVRAFFRNRA